MCSVKYSETGPLCVAQGLCGHIDCGFTDRLNNFDVWEQCIARKMSMINALIVLMKYCRFCVSSPFVVRSVHMAILRRLLRVIHPWVVRAAAKGNLGVIPRPGARALGTLRRLPMLVATHMESTYFDVLASAVVCSPTYCLKTISWFSCWFSG